MKFHYHRFSRFLLYLKEDEAVIELKVESDNCWTAFSGRHSGYGGQGCCLYEPFADHQPYIPILLVSGDQAPVAEKDKGIRNLEQLLRDYGIKDLTVKLYPGGRHEMPHETNRPVVMDDISKCLEKKIFLLVNAKAADHK